MKQRIPLFLLFLCLAVIAGVLDNLLIGADLTKWTVTLFTLTGVYVLRVVVEYIALKNSGDERSQYQLRKTISLVFWVVAVLVLLRAAVENPQAIMVAYGLVAAGIAVSLQDFFKNFVGGIMLLTSRMYRVGDRIEVDGVHGDVMDVGMLYTTLLEIRGWVDGDQATGRINAIPNGYVISKTIHNYSKDHNFLWDEISIPITYGSDWRKAQEIFTEIVSRETTEATQSAEAGIQKIGERYYLSKRNTEPAVYITMTDNWIQLHIRFVVEIRDRRLVHNQISEKLLEAIESHEDVEIASETVNINTWSQ